MSEHDLGLEFEEQQGAEVQWLKFGEDIVDGDVIEGVFVEPRYKEFSNGVQTSYIVYTPGGNLYGINGNAKLNAKMNGILPDDYIRLTYQGQEETGKTNEDGTAQTRHLMLLEKAKPSDKIKALVEEAAQFKNKNPQAAPQTAASKQQSVQDFLSSGKGLNG